MPRTLTSQFVRRVGAAVARAATQGTKRRRSVPPREGSQPSSGTPTAYRGDFTGRSSITYAPRADGDADPGEVVWAWVPYEEDHTRGKDRPVLVIGLLGGDLLGLMLTSKDHDAPARRESPAGGPRWYDLGSGAWDKQGRPSEVRLDRVLRLSPSAVRREGAALDRERFEAVAAAAREVLGW
ncbi:type II toxin-antitoxin system PemK/MazF family toxin [soil metagenome]